MKFLRKPPAAALVRGLAAAAAMACGIFLAGCASPGRPSPPSLQIPRAVTDLTATRFGDDVHLRWTTPARTADGIDLKPPILAEICRTPTASASSRAQPCSIVQSLAVHPGISEATDTLPAALVSASPALLAYRIQLRGQLNKTTGPSAPAYSASGPAPLAVLDLRATDTRAGALLQWTPPPPNPKAASAVDTVELTRTLASAPASTPPPTPSRAANPFRLRQSPAVPDSAGTVHLSAGPGDAGGTLDRTAELGATYQYAATRVRTLTLGSRTLEVRSEPSLPVTVTLRDVFPPSPPAGLLATPGPGSIDLSWDPGTDSRIAGYRVYRLDQTAASASGAAWQRLTPDLLPTPAFRDLSASPGHPYRYRVTAVDVSGNESPPSPETTETAP